MELEPHFSMQLTVDDSLADELERIALEESIETEKVISEEAQITPEEPRNLELDLETQKQILEIDRVAPYSDNVHRYDGTLKGFELVSEFNSTPEEITKIRELADRFSLSPISRRIFEVLVEDIGLGPNYDSANDLWVDDLLYEIAHLVFDLGLEIDPEIVEEQIFTMQTGMCPQGRTTRLVQVISALRSKKIS